MDFKILCYILFSTFVLAKSQQINYYGNSRLINPGPYNYQYPPLPPRLPPINCEPIYATVDFSYLRFMLDKLGYKVVPKHIENPQNFGQIVQASRGGFDSGSANVVKDDQIRYSGEKQEQGTVNSFQLPQTETINKQANQQGGLFAEANLGSTAFDQGPIQKFGKPGFALQIPDSFKRQQTNSKLLLPNANEDNDKPVFYTEDLNKASPNSELSKNMKSLLYNTDNTKSKDDSIYFPDDIVIAKLDDNDDNLRNFHSTTEKSTAGGFYYPDQHMKRVEYENSKGHLNNSNLKYTIFDDELTTTTIRNNLLRQIIDTGFNAPFYDENCPEGHKQDSRGICRPVW